jgi:hypothetical protein
VLLRLTSSTISYTLRPQRHRQLLRLVTFQLKLFDLFRHAHPVWPIELGSATTTCRQQWSPAVPISI